MSGHTERIRRVIGHGALLALLALAGCGGGAGSEPDAAVGPDAFPFPGCDLGPPAIDECYTGHAFAECGGDDPPVFACTLVGQCRWFPGGCVAEGYLASTCPLDDLCCEAGRPFPADAEVRALSVSSMLYGFGHEPWDRDRAMTMEVVVNPELRRTVSLIQCLRDGGDVAEGPCAFGPPQSVSGQVFAYDTLYSALVFPAITGEAVVLEIDFAAPSAGGAARARGCLIRFAGDLTETCEPDVPVRCAESGTVTVARVPLPGEDVTELPLVSELEFADGLVVRAGF